MIAPLLRFVRWVWRLGDPAGPVPVYWLAVAGMLAGMLARPIHDVDIFWQLKLGELTLAGGLPRTEPFLAGKGHEPLAVVAWLGQAVFAAVRLLGGWDLLRLFDAAAWLGGYAIVGRAVAGRVRNHWVLAAAAWAGWFAAVPFASIRPQTFAVLCFGLLVVLTRSGLPGRAKVLLGGVLLVLWQNLHPSAAVGAAYLGAAAAGEWAAYLLGRGAKPGPALPLLAAAAAAATLATPAGVDIYRISRENLDRCVWDQLWITEWLPIWEAFPTYGRANATPVLVATGVALLIRGRRARAVDLFPALVLAAMTVLTFRFVLFWGVAVIPVWAQMLSPADPDPPPFPAMPVRKVRRAVAAAGFLLALLPLLVLPLNFIPTYPFAGAAALKAERVRGPVYCNFLWGGVVTDLGHPDWRPTHDGRYYLFTRAELEYHFAASRGNVPVAELEREFRPVAFFLRPGSDDALIGQLRSHPGWREVFADDYSVVFVRR